ncbi:MAG TPA: hypothetical protein VMZ28_19820 [Kofleriaceae bacterium]|nr:hypothetical protein [Kofleriaceae bacterium]
MKRIALGALLLLAACSKNETVKKVEALAERACACTDAACADAVEKDYYALVKDGQKRGSEDDRDAVESAFGRMRDCIAAARTTAPPAPAEPK